MYLKHVSAGKSILITGEYVLPSCELYADRT